MSLRYSIVGIVLLLMISRFFLLSPEAMQYPNNTVRALSGKPMIRAFCWDVKVNGNSCGDLIATAYSENEISLDVARRRVEKDWHQCRECGQVGSYWMLDDVCKENRKDSNVSTLGRNDEYARKVFTEGYLFKDALIRGHTVFLCGKEVKKEAAMKAVCLTDDSHVNLLEVVAVDQKWGLMYSDNKCDELVLNGDLLRPLQNRVVRLEGTVIRHVLRWFNIAHYFYESFQPFWNLVDSMVSGKRELEGDWLHLGSKVTVLLDSVIDHHKSPANHWEWTDAWNVSHIVEEGVPSSADKIETPVTRETKKESEFNWVRSLYYCTMVYKTSYTTHPQNPTLTFSTETLVIPTEYRHYMFSFQMNPKQRREAFDRLRAQLHRCAGVIDLGQQITLYTRSNTGRRRWETNSVALVEERIRERTDVGIVSKLPATFVEQVRLFANSSAMLMPHGAASTNIIAAPIQGVYVELAPGGESKSWVSLFGLTSVVDYQIMGVGPEAWMQENGELYSADPEAYAAIQNYNNFSVPNPFQFQTKVDEVLGILCHSLYRKEFLRYSMAMGGGFPNRRVVMRYIQDLAKRLQCDFSNEQDT